LHGTLCREEESIFSWEPRYGVYTEAQHVDGESREVRQQRGHQAAP
jgi:hypothetical protein